MDAQMKLRLGERLVAAAPATRPATQALLDFVIPAARAVLATGGDADEVWSAVTITAAEGLGIDLTDPEQAAAGFAIGELIMMVAGEQR